MNEGAPAAPWPVRAARPEICPGPGRSLWSSGALGSSHGTPGLGVASGPVDAGPGAALAALGGALASPTTSLVPGVGAQTIVLSFAVVAIAGLGQIEGAALSALMIGMGRSIAVYFEPELEVVVPYLIMVAVLLVRPQGLFGVVETRRV